MRRAPVQMNPNTSPTPQSPIGKVNSELAKLRIWNRPLGWMLLLAVVAIGLFMATFLQESAKRAAERLWAASGPIPIHLEPLDAAKLDEIANRRPPNDLSRVVGSRFKVEVAVTGVVKASCYVDTVPSRLWTIVQIVDSGNVARDVLEESGIRAEFTIDAKDLLGRGFGAGPHQLITVVEPDPNSIKVPRVLVCIYNADDPEAAVLLGSTEGKAAGRPYRLAPLAFDLAQE